MEVRLSDLASATGVPSPTIKYYLREGLLQRGTPTSATQATYDDRHIRRLAFVRAMIELGGYSIRAVRAVVDVIDAGGTATAALRAMQVAVTADQEPAGEQVAADVGRFLDELGWEGRPEDPARVVLSRCLVALRASGRSVDATVFRPYARAAAWLVTEELEGDDVAMSAEDAVLAAIVADAASAALRRLARDEVARGRRP